MSSHHRRTCSSRCTAATSASDQRTPVGKARNARSASAGATNRLTSTSRVPRGSSVAYARASAPPKAWGMSWLVSAIERATIFSTSVGIRPTGGAAASAVAGAAGPRRAAGPRPAGDPAGDRRGGGSTPARSRGADEVEEHVGARLAAAVLVRAQHARGDPDPPGQLDLGEPGAATGVAQRGGGVHDGQVSGSASLPEPPGSVHRTHSPRGTGSVTQNARQRRRSA